MTNTGITMSGSNVARTKGAGYYLHRIAVIFSLFFIAYSLFAIFNTLMDIARRGDTAGHLLTAGAFLAADVILVGYVSSALRGGALKKLAKSMRTKGFFEPAAGEEQFVPAQKVYLGIDLRHRTAGVASVYASGSNRRKRVVFSADVIESYELSGAVLILNLRSVQVPTLRIMTLSGDRAYRAIEMLCKMGPNPELNRDETYQAARSQMKAQDWLIERDY